MKKIGLLMDFFRPEILEGVRAYCSEHGIFLDPRWSVRADWMEKDVEWDGLIFSILDQPETAKRIRRWKIAKVSLRAWSGCPVVDNDWQGCGRMAVDALLEADRRPVVCLVEHDATPPVKQAFRNRRSVNRTAGPRRVVALIDEFAEGCRQRLIERGDAALWHPCHIRTKRWSVKAINDGLIHAIRSIPGPVALALPHSGVAFDLQLLLAEQGLRIPEDVSMVTIDKDVQRTAELAAVPISTVRLDEWNQGYRAAELVASLLEGRSVDSTTVSIPPLTVEGRASTMQQQRRDAYVARALELIRRLHPQPLPVASLAKRLHLGRRTLEIRFRAETGRSIQQEIVSRRLDTAKRLLLLGEASLSEISERSGFSSIHYFSNVFKKEIGESPAAWRARQRQ